MSSLDLLDTTEQAGGMFGAQYVPKDAWDIMGQGAVSMAMPTSLGKLWDKKSLAERDAEVSKRFGKSVDDLIGMGTLEGLSLREGLDEERGIRLDALISEGRKKQDPLWKDIKTTQELKDEVSLLGKQEEEKFSSNIGQANSTSAKVFGIGGAALSSVVTDPINLATLPFGAGASMGILRAMGTEALLNMGIEAAEIPLYKEWADRVGRKYGVQEAAMDVATAGLGAAGIVGALKAAGKGVSLIRGQSMQYLDKLAASKNLPSEVRDAAKYQSRVAHVDEEIPFGDIGDSSSVATHRQALDETRKALNEGRQPQYSETVQRFSKDLEEPANVKQVETFRTITNADDTTKKVPMLVSKGQVGEPIRKPRDVVDFVISKGGINSDDANIGDIKNFDLKGMNKGNSGLLMRKKGKDLDDLREAAEEAGYLPPDSTVNDLLNAIDNTVRGQPVFSTKNLDEVSRYNEAVASNQGNDVLDAETYNVYESLKRRGTQGVSKDEMRAIAEKHLKSTNDDTLDDFIDDFLERQAIKEYDGLSSEEVSLVKNSQSPITPAKRSFEQVERQLEEVEKPEIAAALEAQFRAMAKDLPDEIVLTERGEVKLSDLLDEFDDAEVEVNAVKSCGLK